MASRKTKLGSIVVCFLLIAVAAVTTEAARAGVTKSPSRKQLAAVYLRIVAPGNAALAQARRQWAKLSSNASAKQIDSISSPLIAAWHSENEKLLQVRWPPAVAADVRALVRADSLEIGDLETMSQQDLFSSSSWETQFARDVEQTRTAANIVRADLGLPSVK